MSNNANNNSSRGPPRPPSLAGPSFRSVPMANNAARLNASATAAAPKQGDNDVIDPRAYMPGASALSTVSTERSPWLPQQLRPVPAFYPLEKSSRLVEDLPQQVASRLAECLRLLSVQAVYDDAAATASLFTSEHVEMHLSLWRTPSGADSPGVLVELQRRKGDSLVFHKYSRYILDAAVGEESWGSSKIEDDVWYSKKVQRLLQAELSNRNTQEHENAIVAIEIAHGLLLKDRMDARQLGLESLCLLTDPRKTGYLTAVLASHVVLLGTTQGVEIPGVTDQEDAQNMLVDEAPFQEIREAILSLIQFKRIGEDWGDDDQDAAVESEHLTTLHNLALAVLANALDVIEHPELHNEVEEDSKPRARLRTASSNEVTNEFLQASEETTSHELLKTLISELGKASARPHNAHLSAKCLGSLCRASEEAQKRAKELGAKNVVSTALEVGVRTHAKLEMECQKVVAALEATRSEEQQQQPRN